MRSELAALFVCATLAGCSSESNPCAHTLASGTYGDTYSANGKTLTVDRQDGLVTIRYKRHGKEVVEHWRIVP